MTIFERARTLEARLSRAFSNAAQRVTQPVSSPGAPAPLEIVHAIVDAVESEVQPAGRGSHVFPFHRIRVCVATPSRDMRARLEAIIDAMPSLADRIVDRLRASGCDPSLVTVKVNYVSQSDASWNNPWFHLDFSRPPAGVVAEPPRSPPSALGLTVLAGTAEVKEYSFALARIDLGRCPEVRDSHNRLIRTNHVAFADGLGDINQSVSRRHAHIEYSVGSDEYRVYDDRSAHGTCVLRNSTTIAVSPGSRGIRLRSGDQIVLGEARVEVRITQGMPVTA